MTIIICMKSKGPVARAMERAREERNG